MSHFSGYQKRWFVLSSGVLSYYRWVPSTSSTSSSFLLFFFNTFSLSTICLLYILLYTIAVYLIIAMYIHMRRKLNCFIHKISISSVFFNKFFSWWCLRNNFSDSFGKENTQKFKNYWNFDFYTNNMTNFK